MKRYKRSMEIIRTIEAYRNSLGWRRAKRQLGLVATTGNLHDGHVALIKACRDHADISVVSIYKNPLLATNEDPLRDPPRRFDQDIGRIDNLADCVFAPADSEMFPFGIANCARVHLPDLANERTGTVEAIATVMLKLLLIIRPDVLFIGEKDYQQLVLTQRMIEELALDIRVERTPVVRDIDGVAYDKGLPRLTAEQRKIAPLVYQTLNDLAHAISNGARHYGKLEQTARVALRGGGFDTEQITVLDSQTLQTPSEETQSLRILAEVQVGKIRLVDNIGVDLE